MADADTANPWVPRDRTPDVTDHEHPARVATTGPTAPQMGVPAPDHVDQLPTRSQPSAAGLWLLGAHGGAGESTLAQLDSQWKPAHHAWPIVTGVGHPPRVLVLARTDVRGLKAAKAVGKQWATGLAPEVELVGLALIADSSGRLPRALRDLAQVVAGGYPRTWRIPWVEAWRLGEDVSSTLTAPREVRRLVEELHILLKDVSDTPSPDRKV